MLEVHVNVELPPSGTRVGLAVSDTDGAEGAAGADIVTVAVCDADPPAPVHVSVKLIVVVRGDVVLDPLMACVPLQPPEAVQDCAFVALHVKVTVLPAVTLLELDDSFTTGAELVGVLAAVAVAAEFIITGLDCPQAARTASVAATSESPSLRNMMLPWLVDERGQSRSNKIIFAFTFNMPGISRLVRATHECSFHAT